MVGKGSQLGACRHCKPVVQTSANLIAVPETGQAEIGQSGTGEEARTAT